MKILIILFLNVTPLVADSSDLVLYENLTFKKQITLMKINESQISDSEACRKKACEAAKIAKKGFILQEKMNLSKGGVNPAAQICMDYGGKHLVYYLKNKNEISICEFNDKSFMLGWDFVKLKKEPL